MNDYKRVAILQGSFTEQNFTKEQIIEKYNELVGKYNEMIDKVKNGTLIELPCIRITYPFQSAEYKDTPQYNICYIDEYGFLCNETLLNKEAAEKRLAELKERK